MFPKDSRPAYIVARVAPSVSVHNVHGRFVIWTDTNKLSNTSEWKAKGLPTDLFMIINLLITLELEILYR